MPHDSRALVTGASSGIGESYARHLARTGHDLILVARREDRLRALADELQQAHDIEVEVLAADLSNDGDIERVAARIGAEPSVDMLINNAGFAARGMVAELDDRAFDEMIRVNVLALARLSHAAMRQMIPAGRGAIVNVSSGTVFMQMPGNAGYGSSKNLVMAFTRVMQAEAKDSGVRVQLLIPGVVETEFHAVAGNDISRFPPERVMSADDLVLASLRGLELGEEICIPSLPDVGDWEAYVEAEKQLAANVSRDHPAARYHVS